LRHIVLLLLQEDQLVVSIREQNGVMHDYTFRCTQMMLRSGPFAHIALIFERTMMSRRNIAMHL
jgi:hypothetical protein